MLNIFLPVRHWPCSTFFVIPILNVSWAAHRRVSHCSCRVSCSWETKFTSVFNYSYCMVLCNLIFLDKFVYCFNQSKRKREIERTRAFSMHLWHGSWSAGATTTVKVSAYHILYTSEWIVDTLFMHDGGNMNIVQDFERAILSSNI